MQVLTNLLINRETSKIIWLDLLGFTRWQSYLGNSSTCLGSVIEFRQRRVFWILLIKEDWCNILPFLKFGLVTYKSLDLKKNYLENIKCGCWLQWIYTLWRHGYFVQGKTIFNLFKAIYAFLKLPKSAHLISSHPFLTLPKSIPFLKIFLAAWFQLRSLIFTEIWNWWEHLFIKLTRRKRWDISVPKLFSYSLLGINGLTDTEVVESAENTRYTEEIQMNLIRIGSLLKYNVMQHNDYNLITWNNDSLSGRNSPPFTFIKVSTNHKLMIIYFSLHI